MTTERDRILEHDYDGIQEYDNPMPGWWLWLFYVTIAFSAIYLPWFQWGPGLSAARRYELEIAEAAAKSPKPSATALAGAALAAKLEEPATRAHGAELFAKHCIACHMPDGGGLVGPNLTDGYWIHGGRPEDLVRVISDGVPEKGMIAWSAQLGPDDVVAVAAHVRSLRGTTPAVAKAPEGQPE